ncbi:hypothetical protein H8356DRAFT_1334063 [Neocallimastix lanati (nom. inval.)]|nr:hypothetical protein H8356DRAFT_1334063 [Neocallimastix sp. JGI-2020a]
MRAESNKETMEYIEEFLEITQKFGKLNNKLSNREKLNYLYSISEDVDEILEDMKKQIRNHNICERYNKKKRIKNKKKRLYLCDSENHLVYNCPFNPKNPHNNIKHIAEQFKKLNISVDEINDIELCYDSDSDSNKDNNDKQYIEFETIDDTRKLNYDTNYCNNSDENNKFKNNNTPNKTENTNIFQKENNINYDFNNDFINDIYDSNEYNNSNYKNLGMNNNIRNNEIASINNNIYNNEIASLNNNNISNSYQNNENENPFMIDKYIIESFQDKINKTNCKLNKLLKCLNEIYKKNNNIQKIIKEYLQYNNIFNVDYFSEKIGENYKNMMNNIFSEKKFFNNKNLSKIDQKSKINTNEQNLKFNSNVDMFEFKSDSLAAKNLGCTTTDK